MQFKKNRRAVFVTGMLSSIVMVFGSAWARAESPRGLEKFLMVRGGAANVRMDGTKTTFVVGAGMELRPRPKFGFGASYDYVSFPVPDPVLDGADLTLHALSGFAAYHIRPSKKLNPYVTGGVVFFGSNLSGGENDSLGNLGFTIAQDASAGTGYFFGGGTEVGTGRRGRVDIAFRWVATDVDADLSVEDTISGISSEVKKTLNLNALLFTVGYNIRF